MSHLKAKIQKKLKDVDFDSIEDEIRERPLVYAALAFSIGLAIGAILNKR